MSTEQSHDFLKIYLHEFSCSKHIVQQQDIIVTMLHLKYKVLSRAKYISYKIQIVEHFSK